MSDRGLCRLGVLAVLLGANLWASDARGQFSTTPTELPQLPTPQVSRRNAPTPEQIRDLYWLRYLQGRSGGGVRTGVPQFIPFGNPFGFSGVPGMGTYSNQGGQGTGGQQFQGQGAFGQNAQANPGPPADPAAQAQGAPQTPAEKRAAAKAAREERKRLAREKAEQRKQEAAAKAKAKAAERKAKAAAKDPAAAK